MYLHLCPLFYFDFVCHLCTNLNFWNIQNVLYKYLSSLIIRNFSYVNCVWGYSFHNYSALKSYSEMTIISEKTDFPLGEGVIMNLWNFLTCKKWCKVSTINRRTRLDDQHRNIIKYLQYELANIYISASYKTTIKSSLLSDIILFSFSIRKSQLILQLAIIYHEHMCIYK